MATPTSSSTSSKPSWKEKFTQFLHKFDFVRNKSKDDLERWEASSTSLNILITGKTGTGKSALVNALIGKKVAKEGEELDPETKEVKCYEVQVDDVLVRVWDSPGLQDGTTREDEYREDIKQKCANIDLMIYCIQLSDTRLSKEDIDAMIKLTITLEHSIWDNSMVALTFANDVMECAKLEHDSLEKQRAYFSEQTEKWKKSIKERLHSEVKLPKKTIERIPIVPASVLYLPKLPNPDSDTGESYWLSDVWMQALEQTKLEAQPAMIKINTHRMTNKPEEYQDNKTKLHSTLIDNIPLIFSEKGAEFGMKTVGPLGKYVGGAFGYSYGELKSFFLLLKIATKARIVEEGEYNLVVVDCKSL